MSLTAPPEEINCRDQLRSMVNTTGGRAVLTWLLAITQPTKSPYDSDPLEMARNCGRQEIGLDILAALDEASPTAYTQLKQEVKNADVS